MIEIFKKSTFIFKDKQEMEDFKKSCSPKSPNYIGWKIVKQTIPIEFPDEVEVGKFKVTFNMLKYDKKDS